ncbi:hypothetical protein D3C87_77070 [compost metagenome]
MKKPVNVIIDKTEDDSDWVTGSVSVNSHNYEFYGKVVDEKTKNTLDGGRIIKLVIRNGEVTEETTKDVFWLSVVANYDRSWLTKPEGPEAIEIFYAVVDEMEKLPTYDARIYSGSKIKKVIGKTKKALSLT